MRTFILILFSLCFAVGKDIYKEKRHRITDIIYKFKDANSCKRIVELSEMTV